MSPTATTFTPALIGQTEKVLNALLERHLAGTGLDERRWITLTLLVSGGGTAARDALVARLTGALHISSADANALIEALVQAGLVEDDGNLTATARGRELHSRIRAKNDEATERLWGLLDDEDLATAARTLATILERAKVELAD